MLPHLAVLDNLIVGAQGLRQRLDHRRLPATTSAAPDPPANSLPPPTPPTDSAAPTLPAPSIRLSLDRLARSLDELPDFVRFCPVARRFLNLLGSLDWEHFPERNPHQPFPGVKPIQRAAFVAAYLVKLEQNQRYMSDLRRFLVEHPALIWLFGFPLAPDPSVPWGFDADASLPTHRHFSRVLRTLPNSCLQFLLDGTVHLIRQALPPAEAEAFADCVAGDTKHILAWVKENNPKLNIYDRFDKSKQPKGDPDCRLGCKRKRNKGSTDELTSGDQATASVSLDAKPGPSGKPGKSTSTPTKDAKPASQAEVGEYYWGYASGVVATKVHDWGEFVLAEFTQTFDNGDATYFFPLMAQVERRLGRRPHFGAFDAAYDAHYVYDYFHEAGGYAVVPLAERGDITRSFDPAGLPLCRAGLSMPLKGSFLCHSTAVEHRRGRYACPLLCPKPTAVASAPACPIADPHFDKGGCVVTMPVSIGARIRYQLDRECDDFKKRYNQRTTDERINAQALELGIERPKLRNQAAITNQNTLIYVLINLRGLQRIHKKRAALAQSAAPLAQLQSAAPTPS